MNLYVKTTEMNTFLTYLIIVFIALLLFGIKDVMDMNKCHALNGVYVDSKCIDAKEAK